MHQNKTASSLRGRDSSGSSQTVDKDCRRRISARRKLSLLLFVALLATPAYGYLDPASGSLILQVLVGGAAGVMLAIRMYSKKIRSWFGGSNKSDGKSDDSEGSGSER